MDKLEIKKCIIGVNKSGTPYHYFRKVKELKSTGLFEVWFEDDVLYFYNKKQLDTYDDLLISIYHLQKSYFRDWKINQVLK